MQFNDKQIQQFKTLYQKLFGIKLKRQEAFELASKCFRSVELTYQQISVSDVEALKKRSELANKFFNQ
jgi:hypothetical protein